MITQGQMSKDYADKVMGMAQANAYPNTTAPTGLALIADRLAEARARISQVAMSINQVALGVHGPRPEPVAQRDGIKGAPSDSIRARVDDLFEEISNLESALSSLTR